MQCTTSIHTVLALCLAICLAQATSAQHQLLVAPTLECASATRRAVNVTFKAGKPFGSPGGHIIQWMALSDYVANSNMFYSARSDDPRLCTAAWNARSALRPGRNVVRTLGDAQTSNGGYRSCFDPLTCGSTYIFKAQSRPVKGQSRSPWSETVICSTAPCRKHGCVRKSGTWRIQKADKKWPLKSIRVGVKVYSVVELLQILHQPAEDNGLVALAVQLITAKLNVAKDVITDAVQRAISEADTLIDHKIVPPLGPGFLHQHATVVTLTETLRQFNEGIGGIPLCI